MRLIRGQYDGDRRSRRRLASMFLRAEGVRHHRFDPTLGPFGDGSTWADAFATRVSRHRGSRARVRHARVVTPGSADPSPTRPVGRTR